MSESVDRTALLRELGFDEPAARDRAVEILVEAGLTNARKTGIAASKRERVEEALRGALIRLCARCRTTGGAAGSREPVPVSDARLCERCGGSDNRRAVDRAAVACRRHGVRRVVVVGGSPGVHRALRDLWPEDLDLRIVPGTERIDARRATADLEWADVVLVWGTSELDHKVSMHYTRPRLSKVVTAGRRGVAALCARLVTHLDDR